LHNLRFYSKRTGISPYTIPEKPVIQRKNVINKYRTRKQVKLEMLMKRWRDAARFILDMSPVEKVYFEQL